MFGSLIMTFFILFQGYFVILVLPSSQVHMEPTM